VQSRNLVYFSSVSENTHRFVQKLGVPATRIPLHGRIEVDQPYVLILPTYGGGRATPNINDGGYVPKTGHRLFEQRAQPVVDSAASSPRATTTSVPNSLTRATSSPASAAFRTSYRFELMGTPDDVDAVRAGLADFWKEQTCHQPSLQSL